MSWILTTAAAVALLGLCLGGRRLSALLAGTVAATAAVPHLAPLLIIQLDRRFSHSSLAGDAGCWLVAYLTIFSAVSLLTARLVRSRRTGFRAFLVGRLTGAAAGAAVGGVLGWIAFGEPTAGTASTSSAFASSSPLALRRPLEMIRACRILCSLTPREAKMLSRRAEIDAVFSAESFDQLLQSPGMVRKFSSAAEGDVQALLRLAADPEVKAAMGDSEFLRRLRAVDVVALAQHVEQHRAAGDPENDADLGDGEGSALVDDPEFQRRAIDRLLSDHPELEAESEGIDFEFGSSAGKPQGEADRADAYWRRVGHVLELLDRPSTPASWLPQLVDPPTNRPAPRTEPSR